MKEAIDLTQRNADVLAVLDQVAPRLRSAAFQFGMEYEDLRQMAALAALENYEKAQASSNPRAYLYGIMRNVLWYKPDDVPALSLDAPLSQDSDARLADLVPAPMLFEVDPQGQMRKERALYASLRKLPLEVQHYLARVHELNAYRPKPTKKGRHAGKRPNFSKDPGTLSRQAYSSLRRDKKLAHVICGTPIKRELDFERDWAEEGDEETA